MENNPAKRSGYNATTAQFKCPRCGFRVLMGIKWARLAAKVICLNKHCSPPFGELERVGKLTPDQLTDAELLRYTKAKNEGTKRAEALFAIEMARLNEANEMARLMAMTPEQRQADADHRAYLTMLARAEADNPAIAAEGMYQEDEEGES